MSFVTSIPKAVLIVDDEGVVLHVLRKTFSDHGLRVGSASSAEQALELVHREGFGCLVTDKNLPGMDGIALIKAVRAAQPHCACILMTAYANTQSAIEALRLGAADYLEKPFPDLDLVVAKVEHALQAKQLEVERDAFLEQVRGYQHELAKAGETLEHQRSEIRLFEDVLEARVRQATADLLEKYALLQSVLSQTRDADYVAQVHAQSILEDTRGVVFEGVDEVSAHARAELARIARKLEAHVGLVEHLQRAPRARDGG